MLRSCRLAVVARVLMALSVGSDTAEIQPAQVSFVPLLARSFVGSGRGRGLRLGPSGVDLFAWVSFLRVSRFNGPVQSFGTPIRY